MTQIPPGAPKIKCLIPKIKPPSFSLNEESNSKENKENIQIKANENINDSEPKLPNKAYTFLDILKEKNELIFFPKNYKSYVTKKSDESIDTKSSENDLSLE